METLIVIASRDPKLLVKGLERTRLVSNQMFEGGTPRWKVFCRARKVNQTKIYLQDQGATILEGGAI